MPGYIATRRPLISTPKGVPFSIGDSAIDRASTQVGTGTTFISLNSPALISGIIKVINIWANSAMSGVKVGTFSRSGADFTYHAHVVIGSVVAGSLQTFSGLYLPVLAGECLGWLMTGGAIENDGAGGLGLYYSVADRFTPGTATYTNAGGINSIGGSGVG